MAAESDGPEADRTRHLENGAVASDAMAGDPPAPVGRLKSTGPPAPRMRVTFGMTVLPKRSEAGFSSGNDRLRDDRSRGFGRSHFLEKAEKRQVQFKFKFI